MKHRRQRVLRKAEPFEQFGDPFEPEPIARRRDHREAVELRLDARVRGTRKVGHQAASLASGAM